MKVGDLVQYNDRTAIYDCGLVGLIIECGAYTGRRDIKVSWLGGDTRTEQSKFLELVHESGRFSRV